MVGRSEKSCKWHPVDKGRFHSLKKKNTLKLSLHIKLKYLY